MYSQRISRSITAVLAVSIGLGLGAHYAGAQDALGNGSAAQAAAPITPGGRYDGIGVLVSQSTDCEANFEIGDAVRIRYTAFDGNSERVSMFFTTYSENWQNRSGSLESDDYLPVRFSWVGSGGGFFDAEGRIAGLSGNENRVDFNFIGRKQNFGCTRQRWRISAVAAVNPV